MTEGPESKEEKLAEFWEKTVPLYMAQFDHDKYWP
jgi:hypothetical protein